MLVSSGEDAYVLSNYCSYHIAVNLMSSVCKRHDTKTHFYLVFSKFLLEKKSELLTTFVLYLHCTENDL